ncbi:hypothetical protein RJ55_02196 [Drechmeria coniospora]|nr:hypothetical protein RJ55_02196 [Drechmeria coniospora]
MPTQHVEPLSGVDLDIIAKAVLKARKVVVITGAGISTNSGIPDFRSENGLYSLIQAQFDAAARLERQAEAADGEAPDPRPCKRRKVSVERQLEYAAEGEDDAVKEENVDDDKIKGAKVEENNSQADEVENGQVDEVKKTNLEPVDALAVQPELPRLMDDESCGDKRPAGMGARSAPLGFSTPPPKPAGVRMLATQLTTSPLSSPPAEDLSVPPSVFAPRAHRRLADPLMPLSSSPLSSPPPVLFDPFVPTSPSDCRSDRRSSTSPSEVDDGTPASNPLSSSQTSSSAKSALPFMKGRDLFDANIWSDPTKTSVFYTFATSLRQKIKEAEPTSSHRFISHLRDRGKLVRCYTQNIDQIEEKVGLSTSLKAGPGSRARFSRRSTANTNQLSKMVDEASAIGDANPSSSQGSTGPKVDSDPDQSQSQASEASSQQSQEAQTDESGVASSEKGTQQGGVVKCQSRAKQERPRSGVECVFLHGSLEFLRCFLCGRVCSWEDDERETETLAGQQPECPHCVGATAAREERGKRALGVGKLRPDIVLYGEEHPNSHLISPIVTHDLALCPDMLLILGTSLRVHGLKVMVREFAKAVHSKNGKVVFVNFTKPPESSWGEVIDYWIQWDCDAWVADLQDRIPKLWQDPALPRRKTAESNPSSDDRDGENEDKDKAKDKDKDKDKAKKKRRPAAYPVALRDTKVTGAYWTPKILQELHRITATAAPARRASLSAMPTAAASAQVTDPPVEKPKGKAKRPRKSAPGALEKAKRPSSTLNPNHGRSKKPATTHAPLAVSSSTAGDGATVSSILNSVKENARVRKRKTMDGVEVPSPALGRKRETNENYKPTAHLKLPPIRSPPMEESTSIYGRPRLLEPRSPPSGPLAYLSPNRRLADVFQTTTRDYPQSFLPAARHYDAMRALDARPTWTQTWNGSEDHYPLQFGVPRVDESPASALAGVRDRPALGQSAPIQPQPSRSLEQSLQIWGQSWNPGP